MQSNWKKKDIKIEILELISKQGEMQRIDILNLTGQTRTVIDQTLNEMVIDSSLVKAQDSNSPDNDKFSIQTNIEKKPFNELF